MTPFTTEAQPVPPRRRLHPTETAWRALADRLSDAEAAFVIVAMGGRRVTLPQRFDPSLESVRIMSAKLGPELARKVCEALPGEQIDVPAAASLTQARRDAAVRRLARVADFGTVAEALGITERQVRRIVNGR